MGRVPAPPLTHIRGFGSPAAPRRRPSYRDAFCRTSKGPPPPTAPAHPRSAASGQSAAGRRTRARRHSREAWSGPPRRTAPCDALHAPQCSLATPPPQNTEPIRFGDGRSTLRTNSTALSSSPPCASACQPARPAAPARHGETARQGRTGGRGGSTPRGPNGRTCPAGSRRIGATASGAGSPPARPAPHTHPLNMPGARPPACPPPSSPPACALAKGPSDPGARSPFHASIPPGTPSPPSVRAHARTHAGRGRGNRAVGGDEDVADAVARRHRLPLVGARCECRHKRDGRATPRRHRLPPRHIAAPVQLHESRPGAAPAWPCAARFGLSNLGEAV